VVVVDNGSDRPLDEVVAAAPVPVDLVTLPGNVGTEARNVGARRAATALVAFADDDSWWAPGALERAAGLFATHPRLGLVAARVVVEPGGDDDPTCRAMAASPLPSAVRRPAGPSCPGVLGFLACGAMVRRSAFLAVGGFCGDLLIGGEEALLALDLLAGGWDVVHAPDVVVHHQPSTVRHSAMRRRLEVRNALWTVWARRRVGPATRRTAALLARLGADPAAWRGAADALVGWAWPAWHRRPRPAAVADMVVHLEATEALPKRRRPTRSRLERIPPDPRPSGAFAGASFAGGSFAGCSALGRPPPG
jgi:GT2 family glycosyltransferase